jgi:serine/threonine-protein kinase
MEFLDGRTLKRLITEEAPLDPIRAIDLTIPILRAARFAHKRGIIHRDLKPHNVMVDADDRVKVTDFGIARAGASDMTQTGSNMGTAQYLSPEQAQGHAVTPQSDLYSIGIVLYEMLTGRLPFDGESAVTIALKQVNEAPIPPSAFNGAVTAELEGIVLHALAKDPAQRFADADSFIVALDQARAHIAAGMPSEDTAAFAPVVVGDPEEVEREGRSLGRWLVALVVVLLVAGGAVAAYALTRPDEQPVPNVTGKPLAAALALVQNAGFDPNVERTNSDAPEGRVIRQDPQPGTKAEKGSEITLTVSDGPGTKAVPDVVGQTRKKAVKELEDAGFKVDERRETSDSVKDNRVISTAPDAATPIEVGSTVTIVVSSGPEQVAVPNVVGQTSDSARSTLEGAGFVVGVREQEDQARDPGTVLAQTPAAGTEADKGATVSITVAKEPAQVAVPDVTGSSQTDASNALIDAGFKPSVTTREVTDKAEDGIVLRQSPSGGGQAKRGSTVTITVGQYVAPTPPPTTPPPTTPTTPPVTPTTPPATTPATP